MARAEWAERLDRVEARLARIEAALELDEWFPDAATAEPPPLPVPDRPAHAPPVPVPVLVPVIEPEPVAPPMPTVERVPEPASAPAGPAVRPAWGEAVAALAATRPAPVAYASPPPPATKVSPVRPPSLEQAIGLKAAGWAGAVAVVAAVGWAIQWAYANGYFAFVTPAVRVSLLMAAGVGLIAAGEWVYRRVNRLSATGPFGAGVAVLFVASYAGHAYYDLYGRPAAFVLMGVSTLVGAAVARRGNLVSVAVLALVGGNLAPALLRTGTPTVPGFLAYLLTLQVVAVALAYLGREPKWWALRGLSLATTAAWVVLALGTAPFAASPATVPFLIAFAVIYQAELIASAAKAADQSPREQWGGAALFGLAVTGGLVAALLTTLSPDAVAARIGCVVVTAATAAAAAGGIARASSRWPLRVLAIGFAAQAAALLVVAVPVAVGGVWVALGWAGLAAAYAVVGRVANLRVAAPAAAAVWLLAVADLVAWTTGGLGTSHVRDVAFTLIGVAVPTYAVTGWLLAVVGQGIARAAWRRESSDAPQPIAPGVSWTAAAVWVVTSLAALSPLGATVAVLGYAWAAGLAGILGCGPWLVPQAAAVLGLSIGKWLLADTPFHDRPAGPVDPAAVVGVGLAGSVVAAYAVRARWATSSTPRSADRLFAAAGLVVAGLLAWAGSIEVGPAVAAFTPPAGFAPSEWVQAGVTLCWAAALAGYFAVTYRLAGPGPRRATAIDAVTAWPALLAAKFVVVDAVWLWLSTAGTGTPLANPRTVAAAGVVGLLILQRTLATRAPGTTAAARRLPVAMAVVVAFVAGTLEVDRACHWAGARGLAEQVAISIFWAVFAVSSIAAGFSARVPGLRYAGLGLFGVTLLKVLLVDESGIASGGRVLSFLAVGLLLLGTSVLYGKASRDEPAA